MAVLENQIDVRLATLERELSEIRNNHAQASFGIHNFSILEERLATREWLWWANISVHHRSGYYLIRHDRELRASRIQVFASHIHYYTDPNFGAFTRTGGIGGTDSRYRYEGALRYGIVLFQTGGVTQNVVAMDESSSQTIVLENTKAIWLNVNDGDSNDAYADNHGSFDIYVKVLDP